MGMVVRSNIMAINANRSLGVNNSQVAKNLEKLSSGFKINRAADDAAGLAISEKMKAQIKGLEQASLNSQDGISLVQTAEGALTEVHDMLNRMKELATKSSNGTIQDDVDREAIQNEVNKLNDEIDRISQSTNFNGINLLDGSLSTSGTRGPSADIKYDGKADTVEIAATTGTYNMTGTIAISSGATGTLADGDTVTFTVNFEDGKSISVNLTYKNDGTDLGLFDDEGNSYGTINAGNSNAVTAEVVRGAIISALKKTELGKDFTIENGGGNNQINFTGKTPGSSLPVISSVNTSYVNGGVAGNQAATISNARPAADAYSTITGASMATFDGTNAKDAVFTINGKKFAMVGSLADASKLDSDVTALVLAGSIASNDEIDTLISLINQKTGLSLEAKNDGIISLKNKDATTSKLGGGLTLQIGDTGDIFNKVTVSVQDMSSRGIGTKGLDVSTQTASSDAIDVIKNAINYVSTNRSELGALQNRLEHTINNLDVAAENMTSANSRIRDTDMAKQMMEYTKMNVLTQSAQAMLAQANQQPQSILQLLQ